MYTRARARASIRPILLLFNTKTCYVLSFLDAVIREFVYSELSARKGGCGPQSQYGYPASIHIRTYKHMNLANVRINMFSIIKYELTDETSDNNISPKDL